MSRDWSWIEEERVAEAVDYFAFKWAGRFGSRLDARHEALAYIAEHPSLIGDETVQSGLIYMRLAQKVAKRPETDVEAVHVAEVPPEADRPSDSAPAGSGTYSMEQAARLVGACYSLEDIESLHDPFSDRVRPEVAVSVYRDPSHANDAWAEVADIRRAYTYGGCNAAGLDHMEEKSLLCRYGLDMTKSMTKFHGGSYFKAEAALTKIVNYMNGV